jgi:nickel transport protein
MNRVSPKAAALLLCMIALSVAPAYAHKVNIFAWVEGDQVKVRANFGKRSRPAVNCPVHVYGPGGKLLLKLKTDAKGECSFKPPKITDLCIRIDAGEGHAREFTLPKEELAGLPPRRSPSPNADAKPTSNPPRSSPDELASLRRELAAMRVALTAVQRKLAALEEPQDAKTQDVINGLCVILGLTGAVTLTLYAVKRRRDGAAAS